LKRGPLQAKIAHRKRDRLIKIQPFPAEPTLAKLGTKDARRGKNMLAKTRYYKIQNKSNLYPNY
jgi:hypothetical protein